MRKRIIIYVAVAAFALALAGYLIIGVFTPKVGICLSGAGETAGQELGIALRNEFLHAGFAALNRNAGGDGAAQVQQVKDLLKKGVTALVLQPASEKALTEILSLAADTPVIVVGAEPENLGNAYFVGCDKDQQARAQAQLVEQMFAKTDINGDRTVKYLLLTGPEEDADAARYVQNVEEVLSSASALLLQKVATERTEAAGKAACKQALSKYGRDMELIFCGDSALTMGAVEAVRDSGRTPGRDVILFGIGSLDSCKELIRTGALTAAAVEDIATIRDRIIQTVKTIRNGGEVSQRTYVEHIILTIDNIDKY